MKKIFTSFSYSPDDYIRFETQEDQDSVTVPGQDFSVGELIQRFSNGTMPMVSQPVHYDGDPSFEDYDPTMNPSYDLVDAMQMLASISEARASRNLSSSDDAGTVTVDPVNEPSDSTTVATASV